MDLGVQSTAQMSALAISLIQIAHPELNVPCDAQGPFDLSSSNHIDFCSQWALRLCHVGINMPEKAEKIFRVLLALTKDGPKDQSDLFTNLGIAIYDQDKKAEAEAYWLRAIEINNADAHAYYNLALLYEGNGDYKTGLEHAYVAYRTAHELKDADVLTHTVEFIEYCNEKYSLEAPSAAYD